MSKINVSYSNGIININNEKIKTSTFYTLGINNKINDVKLNDNDDTFIDEQQDLRALDMMKDGSIGNNISNSVYSIVYPTRDPLPFHFLHTLEDKFIGHFEKTNKIKNYAWTKVSKDSKLNPILPSRTIFKESGLDTEYFIDKPSFVMNFANEVIDPAGRAPYDPKTDIIFPSINTELIIQQSFLYFFGFLGCSLNATKRSNVTKYDYSININNLTIVKPDTKTKNIDWFQGNQKKNAFIKNGNPTTEIKNGLLVCKELGDVLQILCMFIWHHLHIKTPYAMSTCDKVVFLQCMLLNLNCILTSADRKNGIRLRNIQVYNAEEDTVEKAKDRFKKERDDIYAHNTQFIKIIEVLSNNPTTVIKLQDKPLQFSRDFYSKIKEDLTKINGILKDKINVNNLNDINQINAFIRKMKQNFAFDMFITRLKDKSLKITQKKKYTIDDTLWKSKYTPVLNNYSKQPFFQIGILANNYIISNKKRPFNVTNVSFRSQGGFLLPDELLEYLEYDNTPAIYTFTDEDDQVQDMDLLSELENDINQNLDILNINPMYFDDYYSELLFQFYLEDAVKYGEEQREMIKMIRDELFIEPSAENTTIPITIYSSDDIETETLRKRQKTMQNKTKSQTQYKKPYRESKKARHLYRRSNIKTAWGKGGNKTRKLNKIITNHI